MPSFANRVTMQGYLEIERTEEVTLDAQSGLTAPLIHGWIHTDTSGVSRHRLMIPDRPAVALLEIARCFQPGEASAMVSIGETTVEVAMLNGKPFVAVEGSLVSGPAEGIVRVSWITLLSTPEVGVLRLLEDHRLRDIVYAWKDTSDADKDHMHRITQAARQQASAGRPWGGPGVHAPRATGVTVFCPPPGAKGAGR